MTAAMTLTREQIEDFIRRANEYIERSPMAVACGLLKEATDLALAALERPAAQQGERDVLSTPWRQSMAGKIIADYLEHYSFPSQGESHMHDCIMNALDDQRDAALAEAVRACATRLGECSDDYWNAAVRDCIAAIEALRGHA